MNTGLTEEQTAALKDLQSWWKEVGEPKPCMTVPGPFMVAPGPVIVQVKSDWTSMHIVIETDGYCHD